MSTEGIAKIVEKVAEKLEPIAGQTSGEIMPDFSRPRHGFRHTVDSAMFSLLRMGISPRRITIEKEGPSWTPNRVVKQDPEPGQPVGPHVSVRLTASGDGLFYRLPTGMREQPENEFGIRELTSLFDDPAEKAACYVRQGGLYFDLRPENHSGCARWIRLFGLVPEDWPVERWYNLARLLPCLHRCAGLETGVRLALKSLLDLDLFSIRWKRSRTLLSKQALTHLGAENSRLGVNFIVGEGLEDEAFVVLTLGPVSLVEYRGYAVEEGRKRVRQALNLVMPCHVLYQVKWLVGDREKAPRLDFEEENTVLGINSHLGRVFARGNGE
jgi:hypothetical protein